MSIVVKSCVRNEKKKVSDIFIIKLSGAFSRSCIFVFVRVKIFFKRARFEFLTISLKDTNLEIPKDFLIKQ